MNGTENALLFSYDPISKEAVMLRYGLKKGILALRKKYTKLTEFSTKEIITICLESSVYNLDPQQQFMVCSYVATQAGSNLTNNLVEGLYTQNLDLIITSIHTILSTFTTYLDIK